MPTSSSRVLASAVRTQAQLGHRPQRLILDVVVETGNPADAERFLPMLERQIAHCGVPPRQVAADGGYASQDNLTTAKALGVTDVAFHKKRGWPSKTWSRAAGCIASCAISAPGSRP